MSMFRSPSDVSSSDPESSSDEQDVQGSSSGRSQTPSAPDADVIEGTGASLQREETASESVPWNEDSESSTDWLPNTAEQHATLLTSSLLEFMYNVRAAEHLNYAQRTTRFHRESPEARALGTRMYQGASKVLASNGIVADDVHGEDWRDMRYQYIIGVDSLGLQVFNESTSQQSQSPRGRPIHRHENMLIRRTSRPQEEFANGLNFTYLPGRLADSSHHREMTATMFRKLANPSLHTELQLTLSPSATSANRYKTEFRELRRLGKGGFGEVYHVRNFVDNQDYAVKKIPLDSKRLDKWQTGGAKEVETLLKEIRTLARLEHNNIVRYYAAWIGVTDGEGAATSTGKQHHQLYLKGKSSSLNRSGLSVQPQLPTQAWRHGDSVDDVSRRKRHQHSAGIDNPSEAEPIAVVFQEDSDAFGHSNDIAPLPTQVLKQMPHIQQGIRDQSSCITSLSNETDIFTDGDGELRSGKLKKQNAPIRTLMVLHIQMSLHPLSLSTYLASSDHTSGPSERRHCFHLDPSLRLIRAIVSGAEYLHSQGIVHRDIKPGNIFLSEHLEYNQRPGCVEVDCFDCKQSNAKRFLNPRIGDFGLVADISGLVDNETSFDDSNFRSKAVGTEFYRPPLAPHQHSAQAVDEKLDVFALGILLFELLWKMGTKMERQMLLTDLSKNGALPANFASKIDPRGRSGRIKDGSQDDIESTTIGECVEDTIRNMVCASPAKRWGCGQVRQRLDDLIRMLDG